MFSSSPHPIQTGTPYLPHAITPNTTRGTPTTHQQQSLCGGNELQETERKGELAVSSHTVRLVLGHPLLAKCLSAIHVIWELDCTLVVTFNSLWDTLPGVWLAILVSMFLSLPYFQLFIPKMYHHRICFTFSGDDLLYFLFWKYKIYYISSSGNIRGQPNGLLCSNWDLYLQIRQLKLI